MATLDEFMSTSVDLAKYNQARLKEADVQGIKLPEQQSPADIVNDGGNSKAAVPSGYLADNLLRRGQVDGVDPEMFAPGTEAGRNLGDLRKTRAYELYAYTDEQKLQQAQKMGKALNMDPALILFDDETYSKTIEMYNIGRGARSLADEGEPFELAKVYEKHPALKAVAEKDMYAGAEALHNIKAVEKIETLAEIIKYTKDFNDLMLREQALSEKFIANRGRNAEIDKEYEAIQTEREKLARLLPEYGNDAVTRIMAESAAQLPMLYRVSKTAGANAAAGGLTGAAVGAGMAGVGAAPGAMTGAVWGAKAGMAIGSYNEMLPSEIMKFAYDGNNRTFDNIMATARASAAVQASIEALSVGRFLGVVGGGKLLTEGAAKAAAAATFGMTAKQGLKSFGRGMVKETVEESVEEAAQDFVSNFFGKISAPEGAETMTVGEMMESAAENFVQALGPSFGLGLVPSIMSTVPAVRRGAQLAAERGRLDMGITINKGFSDYINMLLGDEDAKKFFRQSPEAAAKVAAETLKEYGVKNVSVDVAGIMGQENGREIMDAIGKAEKLTAEQVQAAVESGEQMQVGAQTFMQVAAQFDGQKLADFANVAGKGAPNMYRMKQVEEALKAAQNFSADETEEAVRTHTNNFYDAYKNTFKDYNLEGVEESELENIARNLIGEVTRTNPLDFEAGVNTVLAGLAADSNERKAMELMAPTLKGLASDYALTRGLSKEGIAVYQNVVQELQGGSEQVQQSARASAILVARRAETYARVMQEMGNKEYTALDYMKRFTVEANTQGGIDMARAKDTDVVKPNDSRLKDNTDNNISVDIPAQDGTTSNLEYIMDDALVRESLQARFANGEREKSVRADILREVKVAKSELAKARREFSVIARRTKTERRVARRNNAYFDWVTNTDNGKKLSAISTSRETARYKLKKLEAELKYLDDGKLIIGSFKQNEFDLLNEAIRRLKISTRKTLAWLKAPNKKQSNLNEKEWLISRTDAFKRWFGDWEAYTNAQILSELSPIEVKLGDAILDKKVAEEKFERFGEIPHNQDGIVAHFAKNTISKIMHHKGINVTQFIDQLPELFKTSQFVYKEPEIIKEGHKHHPNIEAYHNYVNKVLIHGEEYLIRFTLYEPKSKQHYTDKRILHSTSISNIELYKNKEGTTLEQYRLMVPVEQGVAPSVDIRLTQFFDKVNNFKNAGMLDENGEPKSETISQFLEGKTYLDEVNGKARGAATIFDDGTTLIQLFTRETETTAPADQSTLPHEFGHMFLRDLQELAEMDNAPEQIKKDWATVKQFLNIGEDGKFTRKQHEQFARHFEAYLMNGEAPSKELRRVFRNFKEWLTDIYRDIKNLLAIEGGAEQLNPDMKAVFDRMLASETEIEAAAADHEMLMNNLAKIVGSDASVEMVREWMEDAKAAAKESMLAKLMKDLEFWKGKNPADVKAAARAAAEQNVRNNAYYKVKILAEETGMDIVDARNQLGITIEQMQEAVEWIRANGYSLDDMNATVDKEAVHIEAMGKGILKTDEEIREMAEEALNEHLEEISVLEDLLLKEHMNDYRRAQGLIVAEVEDEVAEIKGDPKQDKFQKKIARLKERNAERIAKLKERHKGKEDELKGRLKDAEAERAMLDEIEKAKNAKHVGEIVAKYKEKVYQERWRVAEANLRADMQKGINEKHKEIVRQYRDAVYGRKEEINQAADNMLAGNRIGEAMDFKMWQRLAERELRSSVQLLSRAITAAGRDAAQSSELMQQAADARRKYSLYLRAANVSQKLNRKLLKKAQSLKKRTGTMQKEKKVSARCRYVENRMLYLFGFTGKQDMNVPVDADVNVTEWPEFKAAFDPTGYGEGIGLSWRLVNALKDNKRYAWPEMSLGEYQDMLDVLDFVYKLGKNEMGNRKMQYENSEGVVRTVAEAIGDIVAENSDVQPPGDTSRHIRPEKQTLLKRYGKDAINAALIKVEVPLKYMGQKMYDYIYTPFKRAYDKQENMMRDRDNALKALWQNIKDPKAFKNDVVYTLDGDSYTRADLTMIALNYGTEKNAQRLKAGHRFTDEQIREALTYLTQDDVKFINGVWKLYEKYWIPSAAMEERISGFAPKKEQGTAFDLTLKDGATAHFDGGYFPIKYNHAEFAGTQRATGLTQAEASSDLQARRYSVASGSRYQSHTKNRVQRVPDGRPLILDFNVIQQSTSEIIHDICFREVTLDAQHILKSAEVSQLIDAKLGKAMYDRILSWAVDNYAPKASEQTWVSDTLAMLRRNTTMATLMWKAGWSLMNIGNTAIIAWKIGIRKELSMLAQYYMRGDMKQYSDKINEWSPYMRSLEDTLDYSLAEEIDRNTDKGFGQTGAQKVKDAILKFGYTLPVFMDSLTVKPYWLETYKAKYNECLTQGLAQDVAHRQAVDAGDAAVRGVIGSNRKMDLAQVQSTSNEMTKAMTTFYGYFSVAYNNIAETHYMNREKDKWKYFKEMVKAWLTFCLFDSAIAATWETVKGAANDDDDFKKEGALLYYAKSLGWNAISSTTGMVPLLRDAERTIEFSIKSNRSIAAAIPGLRWSAKLADGIGKYGKNDFIGGTADTAEGTLSPLLGAPTNLITAAANITRGAFTDDYTLMQAIIATLTDKRLKDPKKNKKKDKVY